jgi:hypothetical protein
MSLTWAVFSACNVGFALRKTIGGPGAAMVAELSAAAAVADRDRVRAGVRAKHAYRVPGSRRVRNCVLHRVVCLRTCTRRSQFSTGRSGGAPSPCRGGVSPVPEGDGRDTY